MCDHDVMGKNHVFFDEKLLVLEIHVVDKKCHFSVNCGEFSLLRCASIKSNTCMYRQK